MLLAEPPYTCLAPGQTAALLDRLPTLPGSPFLGSTQCAFLETTIGSLIRVLLIDRAALHLLRSTDLAWPSISGLPSTDETLLSYAGLPG